MSRWRIGVVVALIGLPFLTWALAGSYFLWTLPWGFAAWWVLAAIMASGYLLGWHWQRRRQLLRPPEFDPLAHWTERDAGAWKLVEARAATADSLTAAQLSNVDHYLRVAQDMASELARHYHPRSADPISGLTVPEILTVIELAAHDLAQLVDRYVPAGHLLTIKDWRRARQATDWYQSARNVWWVVSGLFSPLQTAARYAASHVGLTGPWQMLQQNLLLWFYTAYLHRVGTYLIELNSGRLRVGAQRYRQLMDAGKAPGDVGPPAPVVAPQVTIALVGQVKAGKSSLVNALLGERRAAADVLPTTKGVDHYELRSADVAAKLLLLDTQGYGHAGPKADQLEATREAVRSADLVFVVLHATNPGRQADLELLQSLRQWFIAHPTARQPPMLGVLTHIDLLSPSLEWSPPYDWRQGTRPKEVHVREAAEVAQQQLSAHLSTIIPVCALPGKVFGVAEELLPAIASRLDEARGMALLRCLNTEAADGQLRKVFHQLFAAGQEAARTAWRQITS